MLPPTKSAIPISFTLSLLSVNVAVAHPQETQDLTHALQQLTTVSLILDRAERQSQFTAQSPETRFIFDYDALRADLQRVTTGIEYYLSPSRAQPRDTAELQGDYTRDRGQP